MNLYLCEIEVLGEDKLVILVFVFGLVLYLDFGVMICGSYVMDICRFVVVGLMLYELIFGVVVLCGMLFISSGYVCMKYGCD